MKFKNIDEALEYHGLGKLNDEDVRNAYGETDKGILVWLPQINDNPNWLNVVLDNEGIILQKGLKGITGRDGPTAWDPAIVITRDKTNSDYQRLPDEYRPIFCNKDECLTIHAKKTSPAAQGTPKTDGNVSWISR